MRLFEVANRFVDDLETILRNITGRGDSKHVPQSLTYPALSHLLKNMGYGEISFDQFSRIYDENPQIQPLIQDYNDQGIVLGTNANADASQSQMQIPTGKSVDQMASAGASSHLDSLS